MTDRTPLTLIERAAATPGTWAGGTISGIWADPAETIGAPARARRWVGTAVIARPAPYSDFSGLTRLHLPIRGRGVRLRFSDPPEVVEVERRAQHQFDGGRPVLAELLDGPVFAFNLIYGAGVRAAAEVVEVGPGGRLWSPAAGLPGAVAVIYLVAGAVAVEAAGQAPVRLGADDALVIGPAEGPAPGPLGLSAAGRGPAELVLATLWPAQPDS